MFLIFLTILLKITTLLGEKCSWDNCPKWSDDRINVHLICHTHDDLGWIKTVDDYYTGRNRQLVPVGVEYIFNTLLDELSKRPDRRFSYAETGFLTRWIENQSQEKLDLLKKLITETGQLELIGGGWTQPDEANSHYYELINTYSLGLGILNRTFARCGHPKIAWQIDPFGHSREHASLLTLMGYKALYFTRLHWKELERRKADKSVELIWKTSDDLKTAIFTGVGTRGTYAPPAGFCFDALCLDDPIVVNSQLEGFNIEQKWELFVKEVMKQINTQHHNHIFMYMGGDFQYSDANTWFTNLDRLINIAKERVSDNISVFYSTPTCYTKAISQLPFDFPVRSGDFFPYATNRTEENITGIAYWTGYFTSKPAMKGLIRRSNALLQLSHQFEAVLQAENRSKDLSVLEKALALSTHHDGITGTSKELVTKDYEKRLLKGWDSAEETLNLAFKTLTSSSRTTKLEFCRRINESVCPFTQSNPNFIVVVFNGNSQQSNQLIRLPIYSRNVEVRDGENLIESQLVKTFYPANQLPKSGVAPFELQFQSSVEPVGFSAYLVAEKKRPIGNRRHKHRPKIFKRAVKSSTIQNELIRLNFDEKTGLLSGFEDFKTGRSYNLKQQFFYYRGATNATDHSGLNNQPSGAYIFRPNGTIPIPIGSGAIRLEILQTSLLQEARQIVSPWVSQVIRLMPNKSFVEFDYIIGPIPKDGRNLETKEIITRYTVEGLDSGGFFFTDANGRQLLKRRRNDPEFYEGTEPVSANYYPINTRILIADSETQLTILTDRAGGGTSLREGEIEIMLHRRSFWDDSYGVDENLDEPGEDGRGLIIRGAHWLQLEPATSSKHRLLAFEMLHKPFMGLTTVDRNWNFARNYKVNFTALSERLPPNINLLTLRKAEEDEFIIRLEHIYQTGEDMTLPTSVDLRMLLAGYKVLSWEELDLAANKRRHLSAKGGELTQTGSVVELKPQEVRTFLLKIQRTRH